jgi:hypothetical protein
VNSRRKDMKQRRRVQKYTIKKIISSRKKGRSEGKKQRGRIP